MKGQMMPRPPKERDLAHDAPAGRFGNAVLACEGYTPRCSEIGRCMLDGRCFRNSGHLVAARMIDAIIPNSPHASGTHLAYLRRVSEMLRNGDIHL